MAGPGGKSSASARPAIRLDKWLWHARFCKTRVLACELVEKGKLRLNGQKQRKPGHAVGPGDVLVFPMGDQIRQIRILAIGQRRGPFSEASSLYLDLDPPTGGIEAATELE